MRTDENIEDIKNIIFARWLLAEIGQKVSEERLWKIAKDFREKGQKKEE
jgi:hypothetical protein